MRPKGLPLARLRWAGLATAFATLAASPAFAQQEAWSDVAVLSAAGDLQLLSGQVTRSVYSDGEVRKQLKRVGLSAGCRPTQDAIHAAVRVRADRFRAALLQATREMVAPEMLSGPFKPSWIFMVGGRRTRIEGAVQERAKPTLDEAAGEATRAALAAAAARPDGAGDWRGRFSDWNFDRDSSLVWETACLSETLPQPGSSKRPFDQFFREGTP